MAFFTENLALCQLVLTTFISPGPYSMAYLNGFINVVNLQLFPGTADPTGSITGKPLRTPLQHPLYLVL